MGIPFESTLDAWRDHSTRKKPSPEKSRASPHLAWERCHVGNADPLRFKTESLDETGTARLPVESEILIETALPYMKILSASVGEERHAIMLENANAFVIHVVGDSRMLSDAEAVRGPALVSEEHAGPDGIGTPLAEGGHAGLEESELFVQGFHPFSRQGIPFRNAEGGVAGSLCTSVQRPEVSRRLRALLVCASQGIEAELAFHRMNCIRFKLESLEDVTVSTLENLRQDIVQSLAIARFSLEIGADMLQRSAETLGSAESLFDQARQGADCFRRRAALWWELVSPFPSADGLQVFGDVEALLESLVDLLSTEASVRQVALIHEPARRALPVVKLASARRALFRAFVEVLTTLGEKGSVLVHARCAVAKARVEVTFFPISEDDSRPLRPLRVVV